MKKNFMVIALTVKTAGSSETFIDIFTDYTAQQSRRNFRAFICSGKEGCTKQQRVFHLSFGQIIKHFNYIMFNISVSSA
jgi:ureidoglycolate hydrolase